MARNNSHEDVGRLKSLFIARGVFTILFGILALVWPGLTLVTFALLVTLWLLAEGVVNIIRSIGDMGKGGFGWLLHLLVAMLQLGVGAYLVQRPKITIATLVLLLGIVLVVEGVIAVVASFMDTRVTSGERLLAIVYGVLSVVVGTWVWRYPVTGTLAFVWLIGLFAVFTGPFWIAVGMDLDKVKSA